MAETEKMSGTRVVFNRGIRTYTTSAGVLKPQTSIALPEKEAKDLLDYPDVIDFNKVAPGSSAKMNELEAENKRLKEQLKDRDADKSPGDQEPEEEPSHQASHEKTTKETTAKKRKK